MQWNSWKKLAICGTLLFSMFAVTAPVDAQWTFIRADSNGDGNLDIADAIFSLNFLFSAGPGPCIDAIDANDDGMTDIADPIFALDVLFGGGGTSPPMPFPMCGDDPTADALDCVGPLNGCPALPSGCTVNADCPAGEFCETPPGMCGTTGACAPIPFICSLIFDPVCGCDGNDYGNACNAAAAGTSVDTSGACPGCTVNADCPAGEFCETAPGMCGTTGACAPIPFICSLIFDPVCGCDGNDYGNACNAAAAGTSVDTTGACPGCTVNADCPAGEFCETAPGMCGTTGACAPIPFICSLIFDPVCGCDGNDYGNACNAAAAGTSVDTTGACPGCTVNADCPAGEFCETAPGMCGTTGACAPIPFICSLIFDPVCGCDGNDYGNACNAAAAGTSVDTSGACPGCTVNADCPAGEFCETAPGMCGTTGACAPIPFICTLIFDPVCGCDGMDYSNPCVAASNGVSVDTAGMCPVGGCVINADCPAGEFCETAPGMCGTTGACAPIPFICSLIFDPVCGCDGNDYGNACNAAAAGTSVDTAGMCP